VQWLRSLLFNLFLWISVLIYAPLALFTFPFPVRARYAFISGWARMQLWLARWLVGIRYRVEGRQHLPKGAAIVLAKHQSTWETIAFQEILPPQVWVLKRELMWLPLFGWALALLKPIAIDRGAGRKAVEQVIEQGRRRRRFGIGGAVLAAETGYPVVPIAHNAGSFWPRRKILKKPGTVRVVIGPVIESAGKTAQQITAEAEHWIETEMARIENRAS
jgi:1-acyl-sn-glycerol-3-phosphate acyltransferase